MFVCTRQQQTAANDVLSIVCDVITIGCVGVSLILLLRSVVVVREQSQVTVRKKRWGVKVPLRAPRQKAALSSRSIF